MSHEQQGMHSREDKATREALTRILAIESRNALARVELAASELSRFDSTPAAVDRISTIHHAVDQIDDLLAKIDLLASPATDARWPSVDVDRIWRNIRKRLDPTLAARGIRFDSHPESLIVSQANPVHDLEDVEFRVAMPESALESILCGLLRVVLAASDRDQELRFDLARAPKGLCATLIVVQEANHSSRFEIDREDEFGLAVQLAEWGGTLTVEIESNHCRVGIFLPAESADA